VTIYISRRQRCDPAIMPGIAAEFFILHGYAPD
jgi:hypothetical protein